MLIYLRNLSSSCVIKTTYIVYAYLTLALGHWQLKVSWKQKKIIYSQATLYIIQVAW